MKKNTCLALCLVLLTVFLFYSCNTHNYERMDEYFYKINSIIKDMNFHIARASENKITLYDEENEPIKEIPFEEYDGSMNFVYARKDGSIIYFITSAAIDDEEGIVFINDDSNNVLDGIKSIKRISGNSYQYKTFE